MVFLQPTDGATLLLSSRAVSSTALQPDIAGDRTLSTRVVVADDIEDLRWLLRAALTADGRFNVVGEAGDGREAVTVVGLTHPDVVVLDLSMPTMDGLEAAIEIADVSPETRVVIYSAVGERAVAAATQAAGVAAFVKKGATTREISDAVARVADQ